MIKELILMNGYGLYVWLSFAITLFACALVYYKTYKTLKKYEKALRKTCITYLSLKEKSF